MYSSDFSDPIFKMEDDEEVLLQKLKGLITNMKWSPKQVAELFHALLKRFESSRNEKSPFNTWMIKMLHYIEINFITSDWKSENGKTLLELIQDKSATDERLEEYLAGDREKTLEELILEIQQEQLNQVDENLLADVRDIVSTVHEGRDIPNDGSKNSELKNILKRLCLAVEKSQTKDKKKKFRPKLTQLVSWSLAALSETGRLLQVRTGEGKSCIVAMFAAFRALRGETVDIMSSSPVLAKRDFQEWQNFYKGLKISADHNCNKTNANLKKCYKGQVVYGTTERFAGDWLRQRFHRLDILGQRTLQCAIVDEVDSVMLDKGHHTVYLSSDMPALQHLNPLLACIWATVNLYNKTGTGATVGPKKRFYQVLENTMVEDGDEVIIRQIAEDTGILKTGSVKDLRENQSLLTKMTKSVTVKQLAEFFKAVERRFPSCRFSLHINSNGAIEELHKELQSENLETRRVSLLLLDGGFCQYMHSDPNSLLSAVEQEIKSVIHFTPCDLSQTKSSCYIPGFLSELVESKLKVWIKNAFKAKIMTENHSYVIETRGIVPVDYSCTGVVENNRTWTDGLQQFLELKHKLKMSNMTLITNYMSNVSLLQKYRNQNGSQIYGMSGTLGQKAETETLQKIYDIKTCQIPSFKRRKLFEVEGVVLEDEKEWTEKICDVIIAQTRPTSYRNPRAVLVICETIKRAKMIHHHLGDKVKNKSLYISNNMDNSAIFSQELKAGEVIIATNLGGRGTDLKVSDDMKRAGGLFVVQTFMPKNARVEEQAFGRTGRQGSPGSAQLIVCFSHLPKLLQLLLLPRKPSSDVTPLNLHPFVLQLRSYQRSHNNTVSADMLEDILTEASQHEINKAKKFRDSSVEGELSNYLECELARIKKKEELFNVYLHVLDDVYKENKNPEASYLSALHEFWGMWLLTSFNEKDSIEDLKSRLKADLDTAREKLRRRESPSSNSYHYIAFGNDLREQGNFTGSVNMYTKAIEKDHCWGAIAYYNRAFTSLKQHNGRQSLNCIRRALEDLQHAHQSVELHQDQLEVTYRFPKQHSKNSHSLTRFERQFTARGTVLKSFMENIENVTSKVEKAIRLCKHLKVKENQVDSMVPKEPIEVSRTVSMAERNRILAAQQLMRSVDIPRELKCFQSLGLNEIYTIEILCGRKGFKS